MRKSARLVWSHVTHRHGEQRRGGTFSFSVEKEKLLRSAVFLSLSPSEPPSPLRGLKAAACREETAPLLLLLRDRLLPFGEPIN